MYPFRSLASFLLATAAGVTASAQSAATTPAAAHDDVVLLDAYVVSSGPDPKTAFDLAQGTSILAGDVLHRAARATLGETLAGTPGVTSTYYGPGASRPIIRGLGGERVRILSDGVGALDLSSISPDHNVAIEPLFASRIEVLRGPSTLLYGSSALGGVVNVIDNRIPDAPRDGAAHGALELRGGGAADERAGVTTFTTGNAGLALRLDALRLRTGDTDIPGVARIDPEAPDDQPDGVLPDSAIDTRDASIGATGFWKSGHLGASIRRYETRYGVPAGEEEPISIAMAQTRYDLDGEITEPFGPFRGARARFGFGRYRHDELHGEEIGTAFRNTAWESRLELPHAAIRDVTGTVGLQVAHADFSAAGEEVVTPPWRSFDAAVFALEEWALAPATLQFGGRLERRTIRLGEVSAGLPDVPGYAARPGQRTSRAGASASLGVVVHPAADYALGVSLAYTERLPTAQELFSNGPHGGTGAYEVGTSDLALEKSVGLDLTLHKRAGRVTGSLSAFANRFSDFIFEQELPAGAIPEANNPEGLTPYQFVARDARFHGAEAEVTLHLLDGQDRKLHLTLASDWVHASQAGDEPLPRMPPWRYGATLFFEQGPVHATAGVRHATAQTRFTSAETATAGYTLLEVDLAWLVVAGKTTCELFVHGNNLTDEEARVATSFLKDFAPLPGRDIILGARLQF